MILVIFVKSLWETSSHSSKYKENMFVIECSKTDKTEPSNKSNCCQEDRQYVMKSMNCPAQCLLFKHINPSYRDLPLRLADFGVLQRNEVQGSLIGLTRVRKFCQGVAYIF